MFVTSSFRALAAVISVGLRLFARNQELFRLSLTKCQTKGHRKFIMMRVHVSPITKQHL